ncbi:MAG: hypothetical protein KDC79_10885 [Cyclobacteriaceae bacterium]|nr:hypothetical protein [Cyclobacteriaceae bacterium]
MNYLEFVLSFFKINDPFRLVPIFLLAFLFKIPAFLHPIQFAETTHWFVIGKAMHSGTLYVDIWDRIAPFSAVVYQVIDWLFGRSILALYILGTLLTFLQAAIFNNMLMRAKVYENNSYLPALIYVLFTSSHPALFTLSPALMGLTLVLLGLGNMLRHVEFRAKKDIQIIMIGLYFGMSSLFYFPYIVFIPISVMLLLIFTSTIGRRYFLLVFGGVFPLITSFFYYWIKSDRPGYFLSNFVVFNNFNVTEQSIGWLWGTLSLGIPLIFAFAGLASFGKQRRLTNYQSRIVQLFIVFGISVISMLLLEAPISYYSLSVFIPVLVFITVHFVFIFKRSFYLTLLSILILVGTFISLWAFTFRWFTPSNGKSEPSKYAAVAKGKTIMVLGQDKSLYKNASLAGPFYDWTLSSSFFNELDYYDNLVFLQDQLKRSKPDVIIDLENKWPQIEKRLPLIAGSYFESQKNVWKRKN